MKTKISLVVFCLLLLAAHFFRDGNFFLMSVSICAPLLLLIKKRWALWGLQILLLLGALIWIETTYSLVQNRIEIGVPWFRMAVILASVTLLTLFSALILNFMSIKSKYK